MSFSSTAKNKNLYLILAVLACASLTYAVPARAWSPTPNIILVEETTHQTLTGVTFGPVGPGCDINAGGPNCAYLDAAVTETGFAIPFGPFTSARTVHLLFGVGGIYERPSGSHDSAGNANGFCTPEIDTFTDTFADGSSLSSSGQGANCCALADCPANAGPTTSEITAIILSGTGRFAGATGGDIDSAVASPSSSGTNFIGRTDAYVLLAK